MFNLGYDDRLSKWREFRETLNNSTNAPTYSNKVELKEIINTLCFNKFYISPTNCVH